MTQQHVAIDLTKNPKQYEYFIEIMKACAGLNHYRKFVYGGAIRGGKTFISLGANWAYTCKWVLHFAIKSVKQQLQFMN